mgnify:CR=1 FL=1
MATIKQKRAVAILAENGGSVSAAMREAGYSDISAATPKKLTESDGWQELMQKYLPDKLLARKHKALLTIPKKTRVIKQGEIITETEELHTEAIKAGLDMAYKLKAKYAPEKHEHRVEEIMRIEAIFLTVANDKDSSVSPGIIQDRGRLPVPDDKGTG